MQKIVSGIAVLALATAAVTTAGGAPAATMMNHAMAMPKCTSASGPVVWYMAASKTYFAKGATMYGKGSGKFVCKRTAAKMRGSHMGAMGAMTSHPHRMSGATTNGSTTRAPGAMAPATPGAMVPATPGAMPPGTVPAPPAMTPGSMASPGAMSPGPVASPLERNKPGPISPAVPATSAPSSMPHPS